MAVKKTEKQYAQFIEKVIKKWQPKLHLEHYTITQEKDADTEYLACRYNYPYLDGAVYWSEASFNDWLKDPESEVERRLVHELCHLITDPLYTRASERYITRSALEDERERLTDHIAVLVFKQI